MEIWTDSQMTAIHKMLNPRSLAVIGATPRQILQRGFAARDFHLKA